MLGQKITINIHGDYLDSFVYSGVLFIMNTDFNLSVYTWDEICSEILSGESLFDQLMIKDFMLGHSSNVSIDMPKIFNIEESILRKYMLHTIELNEWPSDISIYNNRFYISSSNGTFYFDFYWAGGRIDSFSQISKIIDLASFKIAPGSYNRLVIAAGNDGVCSIVPKMKFIQDKDVTTIISEPCNYLDWFENKVIANTRVGVKFANYQPMVKEKDFQGTKKEFWDKISHLKTIKPTVQDVNEIGNVKIASSFYSGNKVYYIDTDWNVIGECGERISSVNEFSDTKSSDFYVSSSSFGAIIESGDSLFLLNGLGLNKMNEDFANYRVFPRAKFYSNHLHVIKDDCLSIKIFKINQNEKFTYNVNEVLRT